jgi:osmoprotectant transport system permease protein
VPQARWADRVALAGALAALAGCALPFATYRPNRIAAGVPEGLGVAGAAGAVLAIVIAYAIAGSFARPGPAKGASLRALGPVMALVAAWAIAAASTALVGGSTGPAQASIGPGAWLILLGAAVVWFSGARTCPPGPLRWGPGAVTLAALALMAAAGTFRDLGMAHEYAAHRATLWQGVLTHLGVTGLGLGIALVIGVPLGVAVARWAPLRAFALGAVGVIQTVPSLALLGLLVVPLAALGLPGIGPLPAVIALTLYALLPIVRNTFVGLTQVDPAVVDAGRGMGMSAGELLTRIEGPLALPLIIEGVRSAAVMIVGIAAVTAFVGVPTLGVLVFLGWGLQADDLILLGAVPMVIMAVLVDSSLRALGRHVVSPGMREVP